MKSSRRENCYYKQREIKTLQQTNHTHHPKQNKKTQTQNRYAYKALSLHLITITTQQTAKAIKHTGNNNSTENHPPAQKQKVVAGIDCRKATAQCDSQDCFARPGKRQGSRSALPDPPPPSPNHEP